jgi:uncharacterized protein (DUF1697 family)
VPVCIALLRGINLGRTARISMGDLRGVFTGLGHTDVTTYLQSGNVVFTSAGPDLAGLAGDIETAISGELHLDVRVLVRSGPEMADVVAANPFAAEEDDPTLLHVTFLAEQPDPAAVAEFAAPAGEPSRYAIAGREVFLHCPNGYGRSKLSNAFIERRLKVTATTRNWRTTTRLRDMAAGG